MNKEALKMLNLPLRLAGLYACFTEYKEGFSFTEIEEMFNRYKEATTVYYEISGANNPFKVVMENNETKELEK